MNDTVDENLKVWQLFLRYHFYENKTITVIAKTKFIFVVYRSLIIYFEGFSLMNSTSALALQQLIHARIAIVYLTLFVVKKKRKNFSAVRNYVRDLKLHRAHAKEWYRLMKETPSDAVTYCFDLQQVH